MKKLLFLLVLCSCNAKTNQRDEDKQHGVYVTQKDYKESWALTVNDGFVSCKEGAIFFITSGKTYSVNGYAASYAKAHNIDSVPISEIQIVGKDISAILEIGKKACE